LFESSFVVVILLLLFTIFLPFFSHTLRQRKSILLAYWTILFFYQFVAFINAYWVTTPGAELDAKSFHRLATIRALNDEFLIAFGGEFYENLLGIVYWLFGSSHFLGEQLSIIAVAISCIVLLKIVNIIQVSNYSSLILLFYALLPSMLFVGAVTLRESFQVLFFMLSVYFGLQMHLHRGAKKYIFFFFISFIFMGFFHHALLAYSFLMMVLFFIWNVDSITKIKKFQVYFWVLFPVLIFAIYLLLETSYRSGFYALNSVMNMDVLELAFKYQRNVPISRTTYNNFFDDSSIIMVFYSIFLLYINFLFSPFPWQITNLMDAYAFLESFFRLVLIYFSIRTWQKAEGVQYRIVSLLLLLYFSLTFMWDKEYCLNY